MKKIKKLYKDWYNKIKQKHLTEKRNPQYTYAFKSSDSMKNIKPDATFKIAKVLKIYLRANNIYLKEVGWNNRGKITCTNKIKSATFDVYIKDIPCSIFVSEKTGVPIIIIIINYHKHKKIDTLEKNPIAYNSYYDIFVQDRQKHKELNIDYDNLTEEEIFQLSTIFDVYFYKTIKNIGRELHRTKNLNCNKLVAVLNKYK